MIGLMMGTSNADRKTQLSCASRGRPLARTPVLDGIRLRPDAIGLCNLGLILLAFEPCSEADRDRSVSVVLAVDLRLGSFDGVMLPPIPCTDLDGVARDVSL